MINHVLAVGRRVVFLLLLFAAAALPAIWLFAPDVNSYRGDIESFLEHELGLEKLKLGELSWYWAGHLGVRAKASSFVTGDGSLSVDNSAVSVTISTLDFLSGRITPAGIHLQGGTMHVVAGGAAGESRLPIPESLSLSEVQLFWKYRQYSGHLEQVSMTLQSEKGLLRVQVPGSHVEITLDEERMPEGIDLVFADLGWLPEQLKAPFEGGISGHLRLREQDRGEWVAGIDMHASGSNPAAIVMLNNRWPFESVAAQLELVVAETGASVTQALFKNIQWKLGNSSARADATWSGGVLKLSATSAHMEMPLIWQALKPLSTSDNWHGWLSSMKSGVASEARADVELPWAEPWKAAPSRSELHALRYNVTGHVEDADISLGLHDDVITAVSGDVELDETGLKAIVSGTRLPHDIGMVSGGLHIPWKTLVLEISGRGDVDAGKLHRWLDEKSAEETHWQAAAAKADFSMHWMPTESAPREAQVTLKPVSKWNLVLHGVPIEVTSGELGWSFGKGIKFSNVVWATPHLRFTTDVTAAKNQLSQWQVLSMRASGEGAFADLTSYFLLPIETASGRIGLSLEFDGEWHGNINLNDAGWKNLLGTEKAAGEPAAIEFSGENGIHLGETALMIRQIHCNDRLIRLQGNGDISAHGLRLKLEKVETASFSGSIGIQAPFGSDPWELNVDAAYLNRNALPHTVARNSKVGKKPWALRASLKRFVWDDAEIRGAEIKLASALNSVAVLKAGQLRSGELSMRNISAFFTMPGGGVVDLRKFQAEIDEMQLELSATLTPESKRGMHWRGFASLGGDFGNMMKRADLTNLFEHGDMQILFSGQGEVLSEQPWWQALDGRLRMRVNNGRIMKGGTLSKFFAAISIVDLPGLFTGSRDDLTKPGLGYKRMQMEALIHGKNVQLYNLAMRASAMDVSGKGAMDIESGLIDMTLVMRPFQNLDALLAKVPLIRDLLGGGAHSFIRRVYRMHGPIANAEVERITPEEAGLAAPGVIERLLSLPSKWFDDKKSNTIAVPVQ